MKFTSNKIPHKKEHEKLEFFLKVFSLRIPYELAIWLGELIAKAFEYINSRVGIILFQFDSIFGCWSYIMMDT